MKKLLFALLVAATAMSCSDEDNDMPNNVLGTGLAGTWKLTALYDGETPTEISDCQKNERLKLNADFSMQYTTADENGAECTTHTVNGVYVVAGDALTLVNGTDQIGYEILSQTATKLRIKAITTDGDVPSMEYTRQ